MPVIQCDYLHSERLPGAIKVENSALILKHGDGDEGNEDERPGNKQNEHDEHDDAIESSVLTSLHRQSPADRSRQDNTYPCVTMRRDRYSVKGETSKERKRAGSLWNTFSTAPG